MTSTLVGVRRVVGWPGAGLAWMTDRARPGRSVLVAGLLGAAFAVGVTLVYSCACARGNLTDGSVLFCSIVKGSPPWSLLAGLATLPGIMLGWYWRTDLRNQELRDIGSRARDEGFGRYAQMLGTGGAGTLAGIQALKRLALNDATLAPQILDTMCSYIRSAAPRSREEPRYSDPDYPDLPTLDVVTAIEAIITIGLPAPDLRDTDLNGLEVRSAVLRGADLRGAELWQAKLKGAILSLAKLDEANCPRTDLTDADLSGASCVSTRFYHAILYGADLRNADLRNANLEGADLRGADLDGAKLDGANLNRATIVGANMSRQQLETTAGMAEDAAIFSPTKAT